MGEEASQAVVCMRMKLEKDDIEANQGSGRLSEYQRLLCQNCQG